VQDDGVGHLPVGSQECLERLAERPAVQGSHIEELRPDQIQVVLEEGFEPRLVGDGHATDLGQVCSTNPVFRVHHGCVTAR
jgi:hypothetical protein